MVRLAERQGGVVHRDQLRALGFSSSAILRLEAAHRIHRLYPAVFALGHRVLGEEAQLRAAVMHAGPDAAISHLTAVSWWELLELDLEPIHVSTPVQLGSSAGLVIHGRRSVERVTHRDLPVTTIPQTLLDSAGFLPFGRLRKAIAEAEFHRLASVDEVFSVLGRGRPGSARLRRALILHQPRLARTLSVLEERFLGLCERHAIPLPEVNVTVAGLMVDALWRAERVVVELDGRAAHATGAAMERDRNRDLTLRAAGYAVLRYTWHQVTRQASAVAADLRAALGLELRGGRAAFRRRRHRVRG
ncbi:MAG TPA: DUF559 domain-containing protein [Thermoleophilaceae bacterium]|nr:DUF559 domain-containing protein [Thermoleophilaceae bacterium]